MIQPVDRFSLVQQEEKFSFLLRGSVGSSTGSSLALGVEAFSFGPKVLFVWSIPKAVPGQECL